MLSTPQQSILRSLIVLFCLISGIILSFRSFFLIPDFLTVTVIIIVIYTYSRLIVPTMSETMIPELIILFIGILIFRMDEYILRSSLTEILTRITSEIVVNILLAWELVLSIISIGLIAILYKNKGLMSKNRKKWFYLVGIPIFVLIFTLVANISQFSFIVIDSMSLVFYQPQDIVRIDIIRDCSGIYGLMIFSCSFLLFGGDTKRTIKWDKKQTLLLFFGGLVGVYLLNLMRIFIVINACLLPDIVLKSFIHSYLGSILILLFVVSYWALIWKKAFLKKGNTQLGIDAKH